MPNACCLLLIAYSLLPIAYGLLHIFWGGVGGLAWGGSQHPTPSSRVCRMRAPLTDEAYEILTSAEVEGIINEDDKKELEDHAKVKKTSLAKQAALNIKALVADKALHEHEPETAAAGAADHPPLAIPNHLWHCRRQKSLASTLRKSKWTNRLQVNS